MNFTNYRQIPQKEETVNNIVTYFPSFTEKKESKIAVVSWFLGKLYIEPIKWLINSSETVSKFNLETGNCQISKIIFIDIIYILLVMQVRGIYLKCIVL